MPLSGRDQQQRAAFSLVTRLACPIERDGIDGACLDMRRSDGKDRQGRATLRIEGCRALDELIGGHDYPLTMTSGNRGLQGIES